MTPEQLVERYKKDVIKNLPSEDADFIKAYINLEVNRKTKNIAFRKTTLDNLGIISFIGVVIALLVGFFIFIHNEESFQRGYEKATAEYETIIQQKNDEYKGELNQKLALLESSLAEMKVEQARMIQAKSDYCSQTPKE